MPPFDCKSLYMRSRYHVLCYCEPLLFRLRLLNYDQLNIAIEFKFLMLLDFFDSSQTELKQTENDLSEE